MVFAAAFPFEPYGTNALDKGAKLLLAPDDLIDKSKLNSDMLRNGMIMTRKFIKAHPELAKRLVWAHLDAVHLMKTDSGEIMPPKSTWFEPKLRDAMFCHMI